MSKPAPKDGERCPYCYGQTFVGVDSRAWCVKLYSEGGCGAYWERGQLVSPPFDRNYQRGQRR